MPTLRELLNDGRIHVFDGAMGTMLYDRGVFLNVCYDELNLRQPIYRRTAAYGHFGRDEPGFTWEQLGNLASFKAAVGV